MEKQRILLKLILDKMDLGDLNLQSFQNRLKYQKKIYLLQLFGLDLGYRYNWHIHGPYCPSLASDLFTLKEEIEVEEEKDYENYNLKEDFKRKTDQVKELWREKPDSVNDALWVELLASLHYLKHIAYWGQSKVGKKEVIEKLKKVKPKFGQNPELLEKGWEILSQFGLDKQKQLI